MKLHTDKFECMSTWVEFKVWTNLGPVAANKAIEAAADEFFRIARLYTRFKDDSELAELNRHGGSFHKVSAELLELVTILLELAEFTDGRFDPTVIDLLELHGYKESFDRQKIKQAVPDVRDFSNYVAKRPSWREIEVDRSLPAIKLAKKQRLDLGSIGKGWAMDCAARVLAEGSENFLISAGGDNIGKGINPETGEAWKIQLLTMQAQPRKELFSFGCVELDPGGQAVASSGSWARSAGKFHHLLDPLSGNPENNMVQTFVTHKSATYADGLSTALFVGGTSYIDKLAERYAAQSVCVDSHYKLYGSDDFRLAKC